MYVQVVYVSYQYIHIPSCTYIIPYNAQDSNNMHMHRYEGNTEVFTSDGCVFLVTSLVDKTSCVHKSDIITANSVLHEGCDEVNRSGLHMSSLPSFIFTNSQATNQTT